jgi:hypothetical protein
MSEGALDLNNLTPEQQKVFDAGFGKAAEKKDVELNKIKSEYTDALKRLQAAEGTAKLTAEERDAYEKKVREFEEANLTADQKFEKRLHEERTNLGKVTEAAKKEAETWRNRHNERIVQASLMSAASANDAIIPDQVVALMRPYIQLEVENADSDDPIFIPKVKSKDPKTGADVLLDLDTGVKQFLDKNPNLVRSSIITNKQGKLEAIVGRDGKTVFTEDQLSDPKFVNDHWDEVKAAMKRGGITTR